MLKIIHILNINNFFPEMFALTMPLIRQYAEKIHADLNIITQRKFPEWPVTYEKTQIHELGKDADYNILFDADLIINPVSPDVTEIVPFYAVGLQGIYEADQMFTVNDYFVRDMRKIGVCGNFMVTTRYTHDFWTPLEMSLEQAKTNLGRHWILDEFTFSRNIARYGLKVVRLDEKEEYFYHIGTQPYYLQSGEWIEETDEEKLAKAKSIINKWTC